MAQTLIVRGVTLIDGTGAPPVEGADLRIGDGKITSVGMTGAIPDGAQVIEGAGLWAVPGLIDTHVHLELVSMDALPVFLSTGVTTIRDLGGAIEFLVSARQALNNGTVGPRLLFTGPMIDGDPPTWPALNRATKDVEEALRAVDEHLHAGADAIKLYTTLEPDVLRKCIEHVRGRVPVTGHLSRTLASEAMEAGISGLEHALLTPYNDCAPEGMETAPGETMTSPGFWGKVNEGWLQTDFDSPRARRFIELVVERDVSFCPTLTVAPGAGDEPSEEELRHVPVVMERWLEATQQRQAIQVPEEYKARAQRARGRLQELVGRVHDAGGRIVAGTDTGAIRSLVPGFALHHELGHLAGAGMSNMDVLRAATARAAEAIRRDDIGTIEAGKRADVLLVRRNPLGDLSALRDIGTVIADGVAHDPKALLSRS